MSAAKTFATAALAGLLSASVMTAGLVTPSPAQAGDEATSTSTAKEKHACKGLNSCKGQGKDGKNACKGHGSCATDGSK
ncbi:MAG: hypothetical protein WAO98_09795 [Alphaproteobacteria bacterium]